jgi:ankyrin repeat protein
MAPVSEIEIVEENGNKTSSNGTQQSGAPVSVGNGADESIKDDVYSASAYGDVEKLKRLVEKEGHSVLVPDKGGFFALQWAALNNRGPAAQFLLEVRDASSFELCLFGSLCFIYLGVFKYLSSSPCS